AKSSRPSALSKRRRALRASAFLLGGWAMALTVGMDVGLAASPQSEGRVAKRDPQPGDIISREELERHIESGRPYNAERYEKMIPKSAPEKTLDRMTQDAPVAKPKFAGQGAAPAANKSASRGATAASAMKLLKDARVALMVGDSESALKIAERA